MNFFFFCTRFLRVPPMWRRILVQRKATELLANVWRVFGFLGSHRNNSPLICPHGSCDNNMSRVLDEDLSRLALYTNCKLWLWCTIACCNWMLFYQQYRIIWQTRYNSMQTAPCIALQCCCNDYHLCDQKNQYCVKR